MKSGEEHSITRAALARLLPVFVLSAALTAPARAAKPYALEPCHQLYEYAVDNWGTRKGMPQNRTVSMAQTRDGYLWMATERGLVRFDGSRFVTYDPQNTPELGSA